MGRLTLDVNNWADDYPEIVDLTSAGESELGKTLWVVRLSDWSMDTKANGSAKEIIYIDGGHHGNEYLGRRLLISLQSGTSTAGWKATKRPSTSSKTRTSHSHHAQSGRQRYRHPVEHQSG